MKEILLSGDEDSELLETIYEIWECAGKSVIDCELSNLIEVVSSNNEVFEGVLIRCFQHLTEEQYSIIIEKVKGNPEKLSVFSGFLDFLSEIKSVNEKKFIKSVI